MKILMEFKGSAKQYNEWQKEKEIDIPEASTTTDALAVFDIKPTEAAFLVINEVMAKGETGLNDGDHVIVFPKAFGG